MELGYRVFAAEDRGKGYGTEAFALVTRYLFDTEPINRASLVIHVDNKASQRSPRRPARCKRHVSARRGSTRVSGTTCIAMT
jgi:hypothetical protein